jgi:hypothetical protein
LIEKIGVSRFMEFNKFSTAVPSAQNAVDIFHGRWASKLPRHVEDLVAGPAAHFDGDPRPYFVAQEFGGPLRTLSGFDVCELGPMEAGHTYQLESLGANVTAIEGNVEAYLKCLVVKEIFGLRSKFFLGDFVSFLEKTNRQFDLIFASGVLYHMMEPTKLISLMCKSAPRLFLWTHYYDEKHCEGYERIDVECDGEVVPHFQKGYGDRSHGRFWGGLAESASWLRREDIIRVLKENGHENFKVVEEQVDHPHGPCFSAVSWA